VLRFADRTVYVADPLGLGHAVRFPVRVGASDEIVTDSSARSADA
jgi:hypothetical protein